MDITHVVRATEWLATTPKHIALYDAFGWRPPAYAHVGLLQDTNGQKLSKRNLDLDISAFRDNMEILPETLVNFVALLGWSHDRKQDMMDMKQLIESVGLRHLIYTVNVSVLTKSSST
jgi:glutamyl-tRNA synthetase